MADRKIPEIQYKPNMDKELPPAWWRASKDELDKAVWTRAKQIRHDQAGRRADLVRFARLYANKDFEQFIGNVDSGAMGKKLTFNVSRSCTDTATARIAKSRTRTRFLTENGDYSQQKRAKDLTQYTDGMFQQTKFPVHARRAFKDACIFGTGCIKIFQEHNQMMAERTFIDEIIVDELDGRNMSPREMHQLKSISRDRLLSLYAGTKEQQALKTAQTNYELRNGSLIKADLIGVLESWHLPSGPEAKDGRHTISIEGCVLLDEPWEKDHFPFIFIRWNDPVLGFWGEGVVAQLIGIQLEINTVLIRIKESQEVVAVPRVLVEENSGVNRSQITDEIGGIIRYRNTKPDFETPVGLNREVYDYLDYMKRQAFEEVGISQLSATSKKPAGLDSRVALREYQDIETERFALVAERFQEFHLDAAKMFIDLQRDLAKAGEKQMVKVKGRGFIRKIKWKDVDLDEDQYVMDAYPTSFLPKTPEGKLQYTQELVQAGYIDEQEALSLLDFPDLEGFFNLRTAAIDDVKFMIEQMIDYGEYSPPEPYMDLNLCVKLVQSAYLRGKTNKVPEERLELLRRFIDECQKIIMQASDPPAGAPLPMENALPPGGQLPPGIENPMTPGAIAKPQLPPRSDLVPQAPQQ